MKLLLLGAPGAGKGTVANFLVKKFSLPHIAIGDILREEAKKDKSIRETINQGRLISDKVAGEIMEKRLKKADCNKGFILDGFPRSISQAKFLEKRNVDIDQVINLKVSENVAIGRLSGRRICEKCLEIYNIQKMQPKIKGICDKCGSKLIHREDDKPKAIRRRCRDCVRLTVPLIKYYKKKGVLREIDANQQLEDVFKSASETLK